jgi:periplasmic protein TonB
MLYPNALSDAFAHRPLFVPITGPSVPDARPNPHPGSGHPGISASNNTIFVVHDTGFHFNNTKPADPVGDPPDWPGERGPEIPMTAVNLGTVVPPVHPTLAPPPRISRSMQGYLIHRVEPIYPAPAKIAGVQGPVLIKAVISTEGKIEQAQVVTGSPWLSGAALAAIKQWRYRPYYLNDKPVEVETEITVTFYLNR